MYSERVVLDFYKQKNSNNLLNYEIGATNFDSFMKVHFFFLSITKLL